jgi:hypothetical protein
MVAPWRDIRALREPDAWDAWLHRLVVRACYRSAGQTRRRSLVELHGTPGIEPAGGRDPVGHIADRDQVEVALERLPLDQRVVIILHFLRPNRRPARPRWRNEPHSTIQIRKRHRCVFADHASADDGADTSHRP